MIPSTRLLLSTPTTRVSSMASLHRYVRNNSSSSSKKTALVLGSSGALGSAVSQQLLRSGISVIGADVVEKGDAALYGFVKLPNLEEQTSLGQLTRKLTVGVEHELNRDGEESLLLDAVVVASGGWEGDPPIEGTDEIEEDAVAYGDVVDRMLHMNLHPVISAGFIAQQFMDQNGLFVVIGATAALSPTPGMVGYGVAKTGAHHFVQTLGTMTGLALNTKSQRKQTKPLRQKKAELDDLTVVGILPTMIDTPSNRKGQPDADFSKWTKANDIAKEIGEWVENPHLRPHSGSLVKVFAHVDGAKFQLAR